MEHITDLISPTTGENYTLAQVLKKGLERAELIWENMEITHLHTCLYGSRDFDLKVEGLRCSESLWCDSVKFTMDGIIPIHQTKDGKLSVGYGCGCDRSHGGQFPQDCPPDNENWDQYKKKIDPNLVILSASVPRDQSGDIEDVTMEEILDDEEASLMLLYIVKELFTRVLLESSAREELEA